MAQTTSPQSCTGSLHRCVHRRVDRLRGGATDFGASVRSCTGNSPYGHRRSRCDEGKLRANERALRSKYVQGIKCRREFYSSLNIVTAYGTRTPSIPDINRLALKLLPFDQSLLDNEMGDILPANGVPSELFLRCAIRCVP